MGVLQQTCSNRRPFFVLTISVRRLSFLIIVAWCFIASAAFGFVRSGTSQSTAPPSFSPATSSPAPSPVTAAVPIAHQIVGDEFDLTVADGDSFASIGSRFGENPRILARHNGKEVSDRLHAGNTIHVNNRHIIPVKESDSIEVNLPQRILFILKTVN
jgi:hypothetical protein